MIFYYTQLLHCEMDLAQEDRSTQLSNLSSLHHTVPGSASLLCGTLKPLISYSGLCLEGGITGLHQSVSVQGERVGFEAHR